MGASQTKVSKNIEELNATSIGLSQEDFNRVKNQCESSQTQQNVLNIIGSTVTKLKTNQTNIAKNMCVLQTAISTVKDADAQNKLLSKLQDSVSQNAVAGIGYASTDESTNIKKTNLFKTDVSQKTINDTITGCIMNQDQSNVMNIIGSAVTDSDLNQVNNLVMECISNSGVIGSSGTSAKSDTTTETKSESKAEAKGMNPLADLFAIMSSPGFIICAIVSLIVASVAASIYFQSQTGGAGGEVLGGVMQAQAAGYQ